MNRALLYNRPVMTSPSITAVPAAVPAHVRERLRGIASMLAAAFSFAIMDALLKRISVHYAPLQVTFLRCVASLVCLSVPIAWRRSWSALRAQQPLLHIARGMLGILMLASFVFAVRRLTLAQTYSLFLAAPLLMTALSVPILKERVPLRRWLAITLGLAGVVSILQPWGHGNVSLVAAGAAAVATVCYAVSALTVRWLGRTNSNLSMVVWYLIMVSLGSGALALRNWQAIEGGDWVWLAAIGVSGALGQFWLTDAFRRAPPAVVAPFEYTAILWAFAIDWLFWSAAPTVGLLLGAGVVVMSGLFVIWDERRSVDLALSAACPPP
jgi:drug/metabolite transporter (DMT)-like permease